MKVWYLDTRTYGTIPQSSNRHITAKASSALTWPFSFSSRLSRSLLLASLVSSLCWNFGMKNTTQCKNTATLKYKTICRVVILCQKLNSMHGQHSTQKLALVFHPSNWKKIRIDPMFLGATPCSMFMSIFSLWHREPATFPEIPWFQMLSGIFQGFSSWETRDPLFTEIKPASQIGVGGVKMENWGSKCTF